MVGLSVLSVRVGRYCGILSGIAIICCFVCVIAGCASVEKVGSDGRAEVVRGSFGVSVGRILRSKTVF